VPAAGDFAAGWIETLPARAGQIDLRPGMGRAAAPILEWRIQVTTDKARGKTQKVKRTDPQMIRSRDSRLSPAPGSSILLAYGELPAPPSCQDPRDFPAVRYQNLEGRLDIIGRIFRNLLFIRKIHDLGMRRPGRG
jgi:hypothetical protein